MAPAGSSRTRFIPLRGLACGLGTMGMSYRGSFRSSGSRVPVHFRSFADFRTVYRDYFGSCSLTHFRRASMRTTFLGFTESCESCTSMYPKFPRHVTAVVKVIECIFERPLHHSRAEGRQFEIVRSSPRVPTQPAENQTDSRCQNASRTGHRNFAYSALASFRIGMSGSASFQR